MSGIYIPDWGKPEICTDCPCFNEYTQCCQVDIMADIDNCPLIPVPNHGRLGDLDALEQMFADIDNAPYSGFDGEEPFYSADDAAQIIRLAPTIIPADVTDINVGNITAGGASPSPTEEADT